MNESNTSLWDSLVASALLGTERRPFVPLASSDSLGQVLAHLDPADPEKMLLSAAAVVALHRQVGRLPAINKLPTSPHGEPDSQPECPSHAGQHLFFMLNGQYDDLLPEWLQTLADQKLRVPIEHLPTLLEYALAKTAVRPLIEPVLGQRGYWLATQNDSWSFVVQPINDSEVWETGGKAQRVAFLSQLRQRDPTKARELIQSTWLQEVAPDRWAFVQTFRLNLSMADEPFLETALDDRAKDVRAAAAQLLTLLPESRLCTRMTERASRFIKWKSGRKPGFSVTLPDECDKEMERDGVQGKATRGAQVLGEKSYWLAQMVNALPLAAWEQICAKATPKEIVEAAARNKDWSALLLDGLSKSAARDGEIVWVEALLAENKVTARTALFSVLPINLKEQYLIKLLSHKASVKHGEPATPFLFGCQHIWSKALSKSVLAALYADLEGDNIKYSYQLAALLDLMARYLNPITLQSASTHVVKFVKEKSAMSKEVDKFISKIQFRLEMLTALSSERLG